MENYLFDFLEQYMPLLEEEKKAITYLDTFRSYKKATILVKEGDLVKDSYFVINGCIRFYYMIDGDEKTTAFYTEAQSFSPLCIDGKSTAAHFVSCVEDSIITVGNSGMDKEMFDKFPRFQKLCLIITEQLLAKNQASFAEFINSTPEQRYLNLLKTRPDLLQRVPQYQIASYLGMKPQSLSRIRHRLAKKGCA